MTDLRILPLSVSGALLAYARDTIPMLIIHITVSYSTDLCCCLPTHPSSSCLPPWYVSLDSPPNRLDLFPTRSIFPPIDNQVKSWSILSCIIDDVTFIPSLLFKDQKYGTNRIDTNPPFQNPKVSNHYIDDISPTTYSSTAILLLCPREYWFKRIWRVSRKLEQEILVLYLIL